MTDNYCADLRKHLGDWAYCHDFACPFANNCGIINKNKREKRNAKAEECKYKTKGDTK